MTPDRRLSCLSIFLFIALCASLFVNFVLMIAAFKRVSGIREAEPIPRFREILLQRGARATTEKIAVITMRGLISSSLPGNVGETMVDDMRLALQQARDDDHVRAIVAQETQARYPRVAVVEIRQQRRGERPARLELQNAESLPAPAER